VPAGGAAPVAEAPGAIAVGGEGGMRARRGVVARQARLGAARVPPIGGRLDARAAGGGGRMCPAAGAGVGEGGAARREARRVRAEAAPPPPPPPPPGGGARG